MLGKVLPLTALATILLLLVDGVHAGMFPPKSSVKMLDSKSYTRTLAEGDIAMVAYIAPWCGHCKTLVPEYSKASDSLSPMIPFYAVDCDADENKGICAKEGVKGFPTIKAFPRGSKSMPREYSDERKAKALIDYATNLVPDKVKKLRKVDEIEKTFLNEKSHLPHAILLHPTQPSIPLLWKVLASRLNDKIHFGFFKDESGVARRDLGVDGGKSVDGVKLVVWSDGERKVYDGALKYEPLMKYFKSISSSETDGSTATFTQDSFSSSSSSTSTSTSTSTPTPTPTQTGSTESNRRAEKRREMESKWAEEERRDRLRREKKENEKIARATEEQDRDDDDDEEEEEEKQEIPQDREVLEDLGVLSHVEEQIATSTTAMESPPTDVGQADTETSHVTPLEAEAEVVDHGVTPAVDVVDEGMSEPAGDGISAATPLEEEAATLEGESEAVEVLEDEEAINRIMDEL